MAATSSPLYLDHVIILLPYDMLANPPEWLTENFTISPGGRHADNKTENRLILFRDGTYVELIAFINDDPEKRRGHWWDKPFGIVDYALSTNTALDHEGIVRRLHESGSSISYANPKAGGRVKPDGQEMKWEVTFPTGIDRGRVPFFCTDVTPRERRVPVTEANTTHPCGALGIGNMLVEPRKPEIEGVSKALAAVLDTPYTQRNYYDAGVPNEVSELKRASIHVHEEGGKESRDLNLSLILQTEGEAVHINERIGNGLVSIDVLNVKNVREGS